MYKLYYSPIRLAALALVVTISTLFIPTMVYRPEEERAIHFGFPVSFVVQNSAHDRAEETPQKYYFGDIREHPTEFLALRFFLSFVLIFLFLSLLSAFYACLRRIWSGFVTRRKEVARKRPPQNSLFSL